MWHDGWRSFLWDWLWMPVRGFLCFGAKPTQRACTRDFPRDGKRTGEGRSQREQEAENRRNQSTDQGSRQERAVNRSRGKPTARMCGRRGHVGQRERMSLHSEWFYGNFARTHARANPQMHRMLGKYHKLPPSCAWSWPNSVFVCSLFFHPLGSAYCVLCVRKEMWNIPGRRWGNHLTIWWPWVV